MTAERPLRIALLTHSVNPRGGVVHTLELAKALHQAGQRVTVFVPAAPGEELFRPVPFEVVRVAVPVAPPHDVAAMVGTRIAAFEHLLAQRLRSGTAPFDIFHAQDPIGGNALANLQDRGLVTGFFRTVHHLDDFTDTRLTAWQRRGVECASHVCCVSRVWQGVLRDAPHRVDAALVANGVDLDRYRRSGRGSRDADARDAALLAGLGLRTGAAHGEPVFLAVGGVEERKNTVRILQAFLLVRVRWPRAQLVVAGGASLLDHGRYAAAFHDTVAAADLSTGPGGSLLLTGPVPDATLPALMRRADALVTPSLREGFGLVVLEALACGTPVVVARLAPFTEYLGDAEVCWADPLDPASIADAMAAALEPQRAADLAQALPEVCRRYSWTASAAHHLDLYRAAVDPAGRCRPPPPIALEGRRHARHALSPPLARCQ